MSIEAPVCGRPVRTCVGCRSRRPQTDLIRLCLDGAGRLVVDRNGPGRGAWLCRADPAACLERARSRRALDRALRRRPEPDSVAAVARQLAEHPTVPTAAGS